MTNSAETGLPLLLWDSDEAVPPGSALPVFWRGSADTDSAVEAVSIPELVEVNADTLRSRYLAWIHDLGQLTVGGVSIVDRLSLRHGLSAWWMTEVAYKANAYSAPYITDVIKLFALEDFLRGREVSHIICRSENAKLTRVLEAWCHERNIGFDWSSPTVAATRSSLLHRLFDMLPYPLQGAVWLARYWWRRRAFRRKPDLIHQCLSGGISFVDYLFNCNGKVAAEGRFASGYWTRLVDLLDQGTRRANWIHHYFEHEAIPTAADARALLERLNGGSGGHACHMCLDSVLTVPLLLRGLRDYLRLLWKGFRCRTIRTGGRPAGSALNLWPFFERDWRNSVSGVTALHNCLFLNLFETIAHGLPPQKVGVFIQENQAWEKAFVYAWKAAGHGRLVGMPHTTVRYWDMRYFHDPRSYDRSGRNCLPMPDLVAVNGPAARASHLRAGYPADQLVEVEALRFLHLCDALSQPAAPRSPELPLEVLVLGDYVPAVTRHQMQLLATAASHLPSTTRYLVRPHPACPIDLRDYPSLNAQLAQAPLPQLLATCDVAYTSNATSAAVDAHCMGIPVVSVLDGESLNLSPLLGVSGVADVATPMQLATALLDARARMKGVPEPYFRLDAALLSWRALLGLDEPPGYEVSQ